MGGKIPLAGAERAKIRPKLERLPNLEKLERKIALLLNQES